MWDLFNCLVVDMFTESLLEPTRLWYQLSHSYCYETFASGGAILTLTIMWVNQLEIVLPSSRRRIPSSMARFKKKVLKNGGSDRF